MNEGRMHEKGMHSTTFAVLCDASVSSAFKFLCISRLASHFKAHRNVSFISFFLIALLPSSCYILSHDGAQESIVDFEYAAGRGAGAEAHTGNPLRERGNSIGTTAGGVMRLSWNRIEGCGGTVRVASLVQP